VAWDGNARARLTDTYGSCAALQQMTNERERGKLRKAGGLRRTRSPAATRCAVRQTTYAGVPRGR